MPTRRTLLLSLGAAALVPSALRAGTAATGGAAFGASWSGRTAPGDAAALRDIVGRVVAQIDDACSPWRRDAAVARFNASDSADWIAAPPELLRAARQAAAMHAASGGAFDPTVGPLVARAGRGPIRRGRPGLDGLEIGADGLRKSRPGLTLDLCGIAKGRALDLIAARAAAAGIASAMIELGGEIRTLGRHPSGRAWQIGIERPLPGPASVARLVAPRGRALATSGHIHQPGHLIDPRTGAAADAALASVTVLDATAEAADAWATALAALGAEAGPETAHSRGLDAFFLLRDGRSLREIATGRMADHIMA